MHSSVEMDRVRKYLSNLLCVVGLSGMLGFVTGFFPLTVFGQRFNVAPVPAVFSLSNGRESIARRFSMSVENDAGRIYRFDDDGAGFAHRLRGPFSRRASYVSQAAFLDLHSHRQTTAILYYGFCDGSLGQELGVEGRVRRIDVRAWSAIAAENFEQSFSLECYR